MRNVRKNLQNKEDKLKVSNIWLLEFSKGENRKDGEKESVQRINDQEFSIIDERNESTNSEKLKPAVEFIDEHILVKWQNNRDRRNLKISIGRRKCTYKNRSNW